MWSLPSHSGSEPLGQPGGARGGVNLEEKALQVSQPLHPNWMHRETAADLIPTVCNLHFPQHTAGIKPWELLPPAFSSATPFFRFL